METLPVCSTIGSWKLFTCDATWESGSDIENQDEL